MLPIWKPASSRFPPWLHRSFPQSAAFIETEETVQTYRLHTVCEEAKCPNRWECWSRKTATFLLLGRECTRSCGFCAVAFRAIPPPPDPDEPNRIALFVQQLALQHVVLTMVARDDLADGGAAHLVQVVRALQRLPKNLSIEVLTSDFAGNQEALDHVVQSGVHVFNHNLETVRLLSPRVRHKANYDRSLGVLQQVALQKEKLRIKVKSGLMVGFGETKEQVQETLQDLQQVGCDIVTIGQYLQSSPRKLQVKEFIPPEQFEKYQEYGASIGIPVVYAGPFVRSSYHAEEVFCG